MIGDGEGTVGGGELPDSSDDPFLWIQGLADASLLVLDVGGHLSDNVYESGLAHVEVLQPLLIVPCA